jgi:hypothetical protein
MSFFVFALIFAFILWKQLGKSRRPEKAVPSEAGASPLAAFTDDDKGEDIAVDVAGLVSTFLGQNSKDLIEQVVSRAVQDSGIRPPETIEPVVRAISSARTAPQPREKQRTKYLLDGDGGYRQRSDRTARLQQQFGGKGLCSPRHAAPAKARQTNR